MQDPKNISTLAAASKQSFLIIKVKPRSHFLHFLLLRRSGAASKSPPDLIGDVDLYT